MDTNVVVLIGRSTRDVEVRYIQSGTAVANMGLAVGRKVKDEDTVSFFDVTLWGKLAELAGEYVKKGKQVCVSGRLAQESWEKDGQKHNKVIVVASDLQFLSDSKAGAERAEGTPKPAKSDKPAEKKEEEIPF